MNIANLSGALIAVSLLVASPALAQSTPARKQPTQEGRTPCNLVANPTGDPDCYYLKQRTQNSSLSPAQAAQTGTRQEK
jgi:hypothetical protein